MLLRASFLDHSSLLYEHSARSEADLDERIRLVIWDLDETFWKGTLTEGGIEYAESNHKIVIELARRGIISTICSKNDAGPVQSLLEAKGLWSYFVFPSINWEPKGPRIATLIETMMLRPETILFIDDNPMNLNEAKHFVPTLQLADPSILPEILENPLFAGKDDRELARLNQYKLLEKRHADENLAKDAGGSNIDFLRASNIKVRLEFDISQHVDRAVELINRTNQLNFTKKRLSEDPDEARAELLALVGQYNIQAGLVHVTDNYGDYGFVGFYAAETIENRSDLIHFCFSCRTLGMGIESWVYRNIGKPWLPMVGEVLSDPRNDARSLDWISLEKTELLGSQSSPSKTATQYQKVIIHGGCNALSIAHYFYPLASSVISEVATMRNGVPIRLDHSLFLTRALDGVTDEFLAAVEPLGYLRSDFMTGLFDQDMDGTVVILDFWTDPQHAVYRHKKLGFRIPFAAPYHLPVKPEENVMNLTGDLSKDGFGPEHSFSMALQVLMDEYEYEGLIDENAYKINLHRILSNIAPRAKIILLAANETWLNPGNNLIYPYPAQRSLNQWTAEVANKFDNVKILDVRTCFRSEGDAVTVNHFDRLVYFRIFQAIVRLVDSSQFPQVASLQP